MSTSARLWRPSPANLDPLSGYTCSRFPPPWPACSGAGCADVSGRASMTRICGGTLGPARSSGPHIRFRWPIIFSYTTHHHASDSARVARAGADLHGAYRFGGYSGPDALAVLIYCGPVDRRLCSLLDSTREMRKWAFWRLWSSGFLRPPALPFDRRWSAIFF